MNITSKISAALAVAAISAAFMGYSTSANAGGNSLRETCVGNSHTAVEQCCNTWVRRHGRPMWMVDNNGSCSSAAACSSGGGPNYGVKTLALVKKPRCYIDEIIILKESHDKPSGRSRPNN